MVCTRGVVIHSRPFFNTKDLCSINLFLGIYKYIYGLYIYIFLGIHKYIPGLYVYTGCLNKIRFLEIPFKGIKKMLEKNVYSLLIANEGIFLLL